MSINRALLTEEKSIRPTEYVSSAFFFLAVVF